MCGICGTSGPGASEAAVKKMLAAMPHRGPDGQGFWSGNAVVLGHARLAIVDLSERGRQPMVSRDATIAATVNGEIYNYPELRWELEALGAVFASDCDSEVVLHAYRAWGTDSFVRFNGMFAFALHDVESGRLLIVRDRLGIKPVYYHRNGDDISFASDTKALLIAAGRTNWDIDPIGLAQYLAHQNLFDERTLFAGIEAVRPGHYLEIDGGSAVQHPYWVADFTTRDPSPELDAEVGHTLENAVRRHLMSDVPVASYLSAGIDSSLVAAIAARELDTPLATFTGSFREGGWYDEVSGARLTAGHIGAENTAVAVGPDDMRAHFDDMVHALDEPRMGLGAFAQYMVAKTAAGSRKMILTGHGGDELFSGYPIFKLAWLLGKATTAPLSALSALRATRLAELPHLAYFGPRMGRLGAAKAVLPTLFGKSMLARALSPDAGSVLDASPEPKKAPAALPPHAEVLRTYLNVYLPGLLVVEDKVSMAHSLESRTPLLDNELVALALTIPPDDKLKGGELKAILRRVARKFLPAELFGLPKRGFPAPMRFWFRNELGDWVEQRIAGEASPLRRLFRPEFLRHTVDRYRRGIGRHVRPLDEIPTHRIWMLLCLESWLRQHETRLGIRLSLPQTGPAR